MVVGYVRHARTLAPSRNLCLAGGVALNGVANAAVIASGLFDNVYVQPPANDAGTSLGAALVVESSANRSSLTNAFLGPAYLRPDIEQAATTAKQAGCTITPSADPATDAARLIADDQVIGWFHGRMEFGPRALGGRSILAHPGKQANTQRVNALIKRREAFRPLAPAVLDEHADAYFHLSPAGRHVYPFMLSTARVREDKRADIPAVVHVDASVRVQTVARQRNPVFWRLINAFQQLTGLPLVLNTSFNDADEPIVCNPADAVRTFLACGLDSLVMEDPIITRPAGSR